MQCYYFEFVVGGLAGHVITWVEVVLVPVLISFLLKKFHVITLCQGTLFFYFFLSCQRLARSSALLSCAYHFRLDSVVHLKQPRKGQQICFHLFFLFIPLCSS